MRFRFTPFVIDTAARRLFRDNEELHLPAQAFELLLILIERRPEAVSQETLCDLLWPKSYVGPGSLHNLVYQLRTALDDSGREVIRTVHGFGFSFSMDGIEENETPCRYVLIIGRRRYPLNEGANMIGRSDEAVVTLDHWSVSRMHARLHVAGNEARIEDLHSKNGTFVNERGVVEPSKLSPGDTILFGRVAAVLRSEAPKESTVTDSRIARRPPLK